MKFSLYYSDLFSDIISSVYHMERINEAPFDDDLQFFPMFRSRKFIKSSTAFNLPLGFYQTANYISSFIDEKSWKSMVDYSLKKKLNITVSSIGKLSFLSGLHIANNPILEIGSDMRDPFQYYSKNHRQNIKKEVNKANKEGIVVEISDKLKDVKGFYDVMAEQYVRRHKMVFQPYDLFKLLIVNGIAKLYLAKKNGKIVGGVFCLIDDNVLHYNWGVRTVVNNLNIGTLILDYVIRDAANLKFQYFDFGSTPLSDVDLFNYKLKWGAINHKVYKYFSLRETKQIDLNCDYMFWRELYSKMPTSCAKKLMPIIVPWLVS